jgi:hypothetical protein
MGGNLLTHVAKCITNTNHHTSVSVNVASSVLDIVCDLLGKLHSNRAIATLLTVAVISVPIIVLSRSTMRLKQKIGLMALFSLSVVMIAMTLTRLIGLLATTRSTNRSGSSPVWGFFWAFVRVPRAQSLYLGGSNFLDAFWSRR